MYRKILILTMAVLLTGCGQVEAKQVSKAETQETSAQETPEEGSTQESTENDPAAALVVNKGFLIASDYDRTLTVGDETRTIKGSWTVGNPLSDSAVFYAKGLRAEINNATRTKNDTLDYSAYPTDLDPVDVLNADDFKGLKMEGDTITGQLSSSFAEGPCTIILDPATGAVKEMTADGLKLETDLDSFPEDWLDDSSTFTYYGGSDDMLITTMDHAYDFESLGEERILELAKEYGEIKDGDLTFHLMCNPYVEEPTLDDVYISPLLKYGDIKGHTLGDLGLEAKALQEYKAKVNPDNLRDFTYYKAGTYGLPEWYYDAASQDRLQEN